MRIATTIAIAAGLSACSLVNSTAEFSDPTDGGIDRDAGEADGGVDSDSGPFDGGAPEMDAEVDAGGCTSDSQCDDGDPCTADACTVGSCVRSPVDSCLRDVGAGSTHACVLKATGQVACWGRNADGQVGDGTTISPVLSASNVVTLTDAIELSVGLQHTCALRSTGRVVCWGDNTKGQLGDGSALDRSIPVSVVGVDSADEVAAGGTHTCLRRGGEVLCWGEGASGQLGDGGMVDRSVPVLVAGLSDAVEISSGGFQGA
jgi:alpha-tubulin suppressor-like RCC1 family protein